MGNTSQMHFSSSRQAPGNSIWEILMKLVDGIKLGEAFVSVKNVALNKRDISFFSWNENSLEVQVFMQSGYEHSFTFDDPDDFSEAVLKLST